MTRAGAVTDLPGHGGDSNNMGPYSQQFITNQNQACREVREHQFFEEPPRRSIVGTFLQCWEDIIPGTRMYISMLVPVFYFAFRGENCRPRPPCGARSRWDRRDPAVTYPGLM